MRALLLSTFFMAFSSSSLSITSAISSSSIPSGRKDTVEMELLDVPAA